MMLAINSALAATLRRARRASSAARTAPVGAAPTFPRAEEPTEPPPPDPGAERHDGFMLRLALGFGSAGMTEKGGSSATTSGPLDAKFSGLSGSFSVDVGAAPVDNFVIHARLSDMVIVDPSLSVAGTDLGTANDSTLAAILFAPALTYYFMPINIYLTGAVGISQVQAKSSGSSSRSSKPGPGLNIDAGKEWWVGDNWGLGAAARFWYTHATDKSGSGIDVSYDFVGFAVLFSATYQ